MRTVLLSYISSLQYGYHLCHYVEHAPSSDENNIFTSGTLCVGACTPSSGIEFFSKKQLHLPGISLGLCVERNNFLEPARCSWMCL